MLRVAQEAGIAVPDDLVIVGFDDNPLAATSDPPLSTLRQPFERIAREVYRLATEEAAVILQKPRKALFEPELVTRSST